MNHHIEVKQYGKEWRAICSTCGYVSRPFFQKHDANKDADDHALCMMHINEK